MPEEEGFYWCKHIASERIEVVRVQSGAGVLSVSRPGLRGVYWPHHFTDWTGPLSHPQAKVVDTIHCNN